MSSRLPLLYLRAVGIILGVLLALYATAQNRAGKPVPWEDATLADTVRLDALEDHARSIQYADPDSSRKLALRMEAMAREAGLPIREANAKDLQGNADFIQGDFPSALRTYANGLSTYLKERDMRAISAALGNLGTVYTELGQLDQGERLQRLSLEMATHLQAIPDMSTAENNLGHILLIKGDLSQAAEHFAASTTLNERAGNPGSNINAYGNLSVIMAQQSDWEQAEKYAHKALVLAEAAGKTQIQAALLGNLGSFAIEQKDHAKGLPLLERALAIHKELNNEGAIASTLVNIAACHGDMGDHERARDNFEQGLELARRIKDPYTEANALSGLAGAYVELGQYVRSETAGEQALRMQQDMGAIVDVGATAKILSETYQRSGRPEKALAMYRMHIEARDSVMSEQNQRGVLHQQYEIENMQRAFADSLTHAAEQTIHVKEIQKQKVIRNGFVGGFALVALFAVVFFTQRNRISKEKARSEELLLNILPEEVAEELKAKGEADAVQIDHVTVLFTDFKGFTALSEQVTPKELVRDLNECFSAFDRITERYGIEKIKTIGDAYMAAGGLPTPNTTHATDVIQAALEMRDFIAEGKALKIAADLPYFEIRVGVHTGPVVAGIVGVKKFQYDIWGDTVNTAARMESSGEPGKVNISEATYRLVNGEERTANRMNPEPGISRSPFTNSDSPAFTFTPRGKIQAKGKGELEMFFVERAT